jgi:type VI secretion system protein ImpI
MLLLKLVRGAERASGVQPLAQVHSQQARFVIGRDPKCDWTIADRDLALSARHCEIVRVDGQQVLRDLSTNGTFVNGSRKRLAGDHVLRHGDRIVLGNYLVEVAHVSDTGEPPARAVPTTRLVPRAGDPAAMVGTDWQQAAAAPAVLPTLEMSSGFTRISKPWLDTAAEQSSVFATVPNVRPPTAFEDTGADTGTSESIPLTAHALPGGLAGEVLQALAAGLGVTPQALVTNNPVEAAQRVGRLMRVAMFALHHQLALQARQMRELGSRASAGDTGHTGSPAAALRTARPQEAVAALLNAAGEAEAMLVRAQGELGQHSQRILVAFEATCQRLAEQLDPATLAQLAGGESGNGSDADRLWQSYVGLWPALGFAPNKPWPQGFVDAAFTHLATAYDETPPAGRTGP